MSDFTLTTSPVNTSRSGRVPVSQVLLDNQVLDVRALEMVMQRAPNQHDAVTLSLASGTLTDTEGIVNKLISFVYGISPRTETWHGYVVKVTEEQRDDVNINFTLNLLGVTLPMQLGAPRFWSNKSVTSVVRDLVNANMLGSYGSSHPHQWKALAQTQDSDWQVATKLAARIGYGLWVWGGVVACEDPLVLYNSNGIVVRLVPQSDLEPADRYLLDFTPVQDAERTYSGRGVKLAYLTNNGKVAWAKQPNYESHRFSSTLPIRSQKEAEVHIAAVAKKADGWLQAATARINGDASLLPGFNVEIVTATQTREKRFDGKWLVVSVQHKMDNQSFQTELGLARPDATIPSQVMPYRSFWETSSHGKPTMFIFNEGKDDRRWASSWADSRARSIL